MTKRKPREWWVIIQEHRGCNWPSLITYPTKKDAIEFGADAKLVFKVVELLPTKRRKR